MEEIERMQETARMQEWVIGEKAKLSIIESGYNTRLKEILFKFTQDSQNAEKYTKELIILTNSYNSLKSTCQNQINYYEGKIKELNNDTILPKTDTTINEF